MQFNGAMLARFLRSNSRLFNILLAVSGVATLYAYSTLYFSVLSPFNWFVWIFTALPALLLFWAPPLLFALVVYWLASRPFLFFPPWGRRTIGLLLTIIVLCAVPQWVHGRFEQRARQLVSGDILGNSGFEKPRILALVAARRSGAKMGPGETCGDFCQRVLLNDVADGVALFYTGLLPQTPVAAMRGKLYRLVPLEQCPQTKFSRERWVGVRGEARGNPLLGEELLKRAAEDGRCVVSREITLAEADVIIAAGLAQRGLENSDAGFNLLADTATVKRIQLFERKKGVLEETYRVSEVTARLPTVPLVPSFNMDEVVYGIRLTPGFMRSETRLARSGKTNLSIFVTETLGLDLLLSDPGKP